MMFDTQRYGAVVVRLLTHPGVRPETNVMRLDWRLRAPRHNAAETTNPLEMARRTHPLGRVEPWRLGDAAGEHQNGIESSGSDAAGLRAPDRPPSLGFVSVSLALNASDR